MKVQFLKLLKNSPLLKPAQYYFGHSAVLGRALGHLYFLLLALRGSYLLIFVKSFKSPT